MNDVVHVSRLGQIAEPHSTRPLAETAPSVSDGEPCLADPSCTHERHQPGAHGDTVQVTVHDSMTPALPDLANVDVIIDATVSVAISRLLGEHLRSGWNAGGVDGLDLLGILEDFGELPHEEILFRVAQFQARQRRDAFHVAAGQPLRHGSMLPRHRFFNAQTRRRRDLICAPAFKFGVAVPAASSDSSRPVDPAPTASSRAFRFSRFRSALGGDRIADR
jgi:hypothetical protein